MRIKVFTKLLLNSLWPNKKIILVGLSLGLVLAISIPILADGPIILGDPPVAPEYSIDDSQAQTPPPLTAQALSVNTKNRDEVRTFYNTYYPASASMSWTGNYGTCNEGTTSLAFRNAVLQRINFFRAMAGIPAGITFSADFNSKAQKAALMMSVNDQLSHSPPNTWTCYTADGATGASKSNLFLGVSGWDAVSAYIRDPGAGNFGLGHRRWVLYPKTQQMGTGDIPAGSGFNTTNALYVLDGAGGARPATREEYVAWPPPGYVPYQVVYPKWSFAFDGADFSAATVSMSSGGVNIPITNLNTHTQGYGENTMGWIINSMGEWDSWTNPGTDITYTATISNVVISGVPRNFTYDVIIFDPVTSSYNLTVYLPIIIKNN